MQYHVPMQIKIKSGTLTEYVRLDVDQNPYVTPDYIEIEMDLGNARAILGMLREAISRIDASDKR